MSLIEFQTAIAHLIRDPKNKDKSVWSKHLGNYKISAEEKKLLEYVASNFRAQAYREDMAKARWRVTRQVMQFIFPIISEKNLHAIWQDFFDPQYIEAPYENLGFLFLEFLLTDKQTKEVVSKGQPPYFFDILKYAEAIFYFSRSELPNSQPLAAESLLQHAQFKVLSLDYDIRNFTHTLISKISRKKKISSPLTSPDLMIEDKEGKETDAAEKFLPLSPPAKTPSIILFLAGKKSREFRSFEIDEALQIFLQSQLAQTPLIPFGLPSCYEDLVEMGLCKPPTPAMKEAMNIRRSLEEDGYVVLRKWISKEYFFEISRYLGAVVGKDAIRLYVTKRKLHSPNELEFHTDSCISDINAWRCEVAGEEGDSPTLLIDTRDLESSFSQKELVLLSQLEIHCPNRAHKDYYPKPLLTRKNERWQIFYTPWFLLEPSTEKLKRVQKKFADYILEKSQQSLSISLQAGECLFLDNKRMLHGRGALLPHSKRHLLRLWIATAPFDESLCL